MPVTLVLKSRLPSVSAGSAANPENTILIVPTKRRIRHLTREILRERKSAVPSLPFFTLELISLQLIENIFPNLRRVDEPVISLLFNQAILSVRDELKYFSARERGSILPHGTFEKIIHVIQKLKESGIYPETLIDEIGTSEEDEQAKLRDIVKIYLAYQTLLTSLDGFDAEGTFNTLHNDCSLQKFEKAFRELFPAAQEVLIVGFDEFTDPEIGFIEKLCSINLGVSLIFDFQLGNPALFGHLEKNYKRFTELGFVHQPEHSARPLSLGLFRGEGKPSHTHIAQNLFKRENSPSKFVSGSITIAKAKDRIQEIELVCKIIKQLAGDNNDLDLSRICVALYRPQSYTPIIREQFKKFGIPVNVTDRFELSQAPPVVAIIGLLEIATKGFRRDDVLRTTGSCYFEFNNNGKPLNRANLATISLDLRIPGGVRTWEKKIDHQLERLQHEMLMSSDDEENTRHARDISRLEKAKSDIQWLDGMLRTISFDQTPAAFERELHQLFERLELARRIITSPSRELIEKDAQSYAKFLEVVSQMVSLVEYQEGKEKQHSLKFYVEQLKIALLEERYNVREQFGAGVLVTSIEETRGLPVDVMIVAGLVDGEFPSVYQSEIFFSTKRMKEREQHHSWENRYLFYQAITNWSEHLYLTYPEQDAELDFVPSSFVDALKNIIDVQQWEYPGNTPFETTIYSTEDLLKEYGRSFGTDNGIAVPSSLQSRTASVQHAIEVERSRVELNNLPEYSGNIFEALSTEAKEQLEQLRHRVYSVSQLESYGKCPYQFFVKRLLRVNSLDEWDDEFSALEKGSVLHEVLFEFYTERRDKQMPALIGCTDAEFAEAHRQLVAIAERKLAEIDILDAFWDLEKELILGDVQTGNGVLKEFLQYERSRRTSFRPEFFEVGFGSELGRRTRIDKSFSSDEPIVAGAVNLKGKVDRIEVGNEAFSIVDYKTGKNLPAMDDIRAGISLQLPLYLYAMETLLAEQRGLHLTPAGGMYYQVRQPVVLKVGVGSASQKNDIAETNSNANLVRSDNELRTLINESITRVNAYVDNMTKGKFTLTTPDKIDKVCTYCDYKTICRIQTMRSVPSSAREDS